MELICEERGGGGGGGAARCRNICQLVAYIMHVVEKEGGMEGRREEASKSGGRQRGAHVKAVALPLTASQCMADIGCG